MWLRDGEGKNFPESHDDKNTNKNPSLMNNSPFYSWAKGSMFYLPLLSACTLIELYQLMG
jgi:hypothetical protein